MTTHANPLLDAALRYAELGYRVIACIAGGKRPATMHGVKDATTDGEQIAEWWQIWPNANVAIATDGLLVVDVDGADHPWLKDEPDKLLDLAAAPLSLTPSGGRHYVFRQRVGDVLRNTAGRLAPHVDTRANGGYILVAPSIVEGKPYRWADGCSLDDAPEALREPPDWLLTMLETAGRPPATGSAETPQVIPDGKRNAALTSIGGLLRKWGLCEASILAALREENLARCQPPLAASEIATIAASVARYESNEHAAAALRDGYDAHSTGYEPILTRLADVMPEAVEWLWPGRIALGKLTLLVGDPGLGKSFLTLDLASRVSCGQPWPDCSIYPAPLGSVVLLGAEDDLADTVRPRLDAMGADVRKIVALEAIRDGNDRLTINLQRDIPSIERAIQDTGDCRLVIIDPISAYLSGVDSHKNADVRALLHPLGDMAARHEVAILAVTHLSKGQGGSALYRAMGSLAFVAAARAAWLVAKDRGEDKRRLFLSVKNNLAHVADGLAFSIVDGRVEWEPDPVKVDADSVLAFDGESSADDRSEAVGWLRSVLADGPVDAAFVRDHAAAECISKHQLEKAKKSLGVRSVKEQFNGPWRWSLPAEESDEDPEEPDLIGSGSSYSSSELV